MKEGICSIFQRIYYTFNEKINKFNIFIKKIGSLKLQFRMKYRYNRRVSSFFNTCPAIQNVENDRNALANRVD